MRARVGWVSELRADDGRAVNIEKLCLSPRVEKLNLKKVIKVSYLNQESRQCFACFSDSYAYEHLMNIMNDFMHLNILAVCYKSSFLVVSS